ncbi:hypothetical protein Tcan_14119 [Toxocara canis]|uniref:Uncharacterized protein n=1 Tax=Toxocara canis TaxID=6265 RepID=A0A0B2V3N0_TOXCA|nr:hypothetical protein Tcan_14119 [Toxocara canis]
MTCHSVMPISQLLNRHTDVSHNSLSTPSLSCFETWVVSSSNLSRAKAAHKRDQCAKCACAISKSSYRDNMQSSAVIARRAKTEEKYPAVGIEAAFVNGTLAVRFEKETATKELPAELRSAVNSVIGHSFDLIEDLDRSSPISASRNGDGVELRRSLAFSIMATNAGRTPAENSNGNKSNYEDDNNSILLEVLKIKFASIWYAVRLKRMGKNTSSTLLKGCFVPDLDID